MSKPVQYINIDHLHRVLRPFVRVDNRIATSMHMRHMLQSIGIVLRVNRPLSQAVEHCFIITKRVKFASAKETVRNFLSELYDIKWPNEVKIIRLCGVYGCYNPWHHQTVLTAFDEGAYYRRQQKRDRIYAETSR